jgi:OOP family OmpA-OmpF porin
VQELLRNFGDAGKRLVSLGTFNGSSSTVTWQLADASLPPPTGTGGSIRKEKQAAGKCLAPLVTQATQTAPSVPGTDVMSALDAAGSEIGSTTPDHSRVVVFTDGLSNTGCLNLSKVLRVGVSPADVVRSCTGQGGFARLRSSVLQLEGIGFQALNRPLTTGEQSWLVNYWRDVCAALKVAEPGSCVTAEGSSSLRTSATARPADPPIAFPTVHGHQIVVPAPLLFAFNSSRLTQTALSYLDILVQKIRSSGRSVTAVIGHTDRIGTPAYNLGLSQRRADAVRSYLATQGFTGIRAKGVGFSQPACPAEHTSTGSPNEACMARDRRVVVILGGPK